MLMGTNLKYAQTLLIGNNPALVGRLVDFLSFFFYLICIDCAVVI